MILDSRAIFKGWEDRRMEAGANRYILKKEECEYFLVMVWS
jgi:hypothetical protein